MNKGKKQTNKGNELNLFNSFKKVILNQGIEIMLRAIKLQGCAIIFRGSHRGQGLLLRGPWAVQISRVCRTARFVWLRKFQKNQSITQQREAPNGKKIKQKGGLGFCPGLVKVAGSGPPVGHPLG